jgi:hypothetical protein
MFNLRKSLSLTSSLPPVKTSNCIELFRDQVLHNSFQYKILLRYAFSEYTECIVFLYDAIQDVKAANEDLHSPMLVSAYDMYLTTQFRLYTNMPLAVYEETRVAIDLMREFQHSRKDTVMIINTLDDLTIQALQNMHQRMLEAQLQGNNAQTPDTIESPVFRRFDTQEPTVVAPQQRRSFSLGRTLKRLSVRLSLKF